MRSLKLASSVLVMFQFLTSTSVNAATQGVTDTEIVTGAHTAESGKMAMYAPGPRAFSLYIDKINEKGGIHGRKIRHIRIDTQGEPLKSVQATKKLVEEEKIFAMLVGHGTSHQAVYKYLIERNIPDVFFTDQLREYTEPLKHLVVGLNPTFHAEGIQYGNHAFEKHKGKTACFLLTDNAMGEEFYAGAKEAIEAKNKTLPPAQQIKIGVAERVDRMAVQANGQMLNLKKGKCDVVFTSTYAGLCPNAISYGASQGFTPMWYVMSWNTYPKFIELIPDSVKNGVISSTYLALDEKSGVPGWNEYKQDMEKAGLPITRTTINAYAIGEMFAEALRRAGRDLTTDKFISALESLDGFKCSVCLVPTVLSSKKHVAFDQVKLMVSKTKGWELM